MFSLLPYFSDPGFIPQARVYRFKKKSWIFVSSSADVKIAMAKNILMHYWFSASVCFFSGVWEDLKYIGKWHRRLAAAAGS